MSRLLSLTLLTLLVLNLIPPAILPLLQTMIVHAQAAQDVVPVWTIMATPGAILDITVNATYLRTVEGWRGSTIDVYLSDNGYGVININKDIKIAEQVYIGGGGLINITIVLPTNLEPGWWYVKVTDIPEEYALDGIIYWDVAVSRNRTLIVPNSVAFYNTTKTPLNINWQNYGNFTALAYKPASNLHKLNTTNYFELIVNVTDYTSDVPVDFSTATYTREFYFLVPYELFGELATDKGWAVLVLNDEFIDGDNYINYGTVQVPTGQPAVMNISGSLIGTAELNVTKYIDFPVLGNIPIGEFVPLVVVTENRYGANKVIFSFTPKYRTWILPSTEVSWNPNVQGNSGKVNPGDELTVTGYNLPLYEYSTTDKAFKSITTSVNYTEIWLYDANALELKEKIASIHYEAYITGGSLITSSLTIPDATYGGRYFIVTLKVYVDGALKGYTLPAQGDVEQIWPYLEIYLANSTGYFVEPSEQYLGDPDSPTSAANTIPPYGYILVKGRGFLPETLTFKVINNTADKEYLGDLIFVDGKKTPDSTYGNFTAIFRMPTTAKADFTVFINATGTTPTNFGESYERNDPAATPETITIKQGSQYTTVFINPEPSAEEWRIKQVYVDKLYPYPATWEPEEQRQMVFEFLGFPADSIVNVTLEAAKTYILFTGTVDDYGYLKTDAVPVPVIPYSDTGYAVYVNRTIGATYHVTDVKIKPTVAARISAEERFSKKLYVPMTAPGTITIELKGYGWYGAKEITINWDGYKNITIISAENVTDLGNFTVKIEIPIEAGTHTLKLIQTGSVITAEITLIMYTPPLRGYIVEVDTGELHFPGEVVTATIISKFMGELTDPDKTTLKAVVIYYDEEGNVKKSEDLTPFITAIDTALGTIWKATFTIPTDVAGTDAVIVVKGEYEVIAGLPPLTDITEKSFTVAVKLEGYLKDIKVLAEGINGTVAIVKTDVGEIKENLAALTPMVMNIAGDMAVLKNNVTTLYTELESLKKLILSLGENVTLKIDEGMATLESDIMTLSGKVDDVMTALEGLNTTITEIKDGVVELKASLKEVNETLTTTIKASIEDIIEMLGELKDVALNIDENVATLRSDVLTVKADTEDILALLSELKDLTLQVKDDLATLSSDVASIKANVATVLELLSELKNVTLDIKGEVATIESDVLTIKANVTDVLALLGDIRVVLDDIHQEVVTLTAYSDKILGTTLEIYTTVSNLWELTGVLAEKADTIITKVGEVEQLIIKTTEGITMNITAYIPILKETLEGIASKVDEVGGKVDKLDEFVRMMDEGLTAHLVGIEDTLKTRFDDVISEIKGLRTEVDELIAGQTDTIISTLTSAMDAKLADLHGKIKADITDAATAIMDTVTKASTPIIDRIDTTRKDVLDAIAKLPDTIVKPVTSSIESLAASLGDSLKSITDSLKTVQDTVKSTADTLSSTIVESKDVTVSTITMYSIAVAILVIIAIGVTAYGMFIARRP